MDGEWMVNGEGGSKDCAAHIIYRFGLVISFGGGGGGERDGNLLLS